MNTGRIICAGVILVNLIGFTAFLILRYATDIFDNQEENEIESGNYDYLEDVLYGRKMNLFPMNLQIKLWLKM